MISVNPSLERWRPEKYAGAVLCRAEVAAGAPNPPAVRPREIPPPTGIVYEPGTATNLRLRFSPSDAPVCVTVYKVISQSPFVVEAVTECVSVDPQNPVVEFPAQPACYTFQVSTASGLTSFAPVYCFPGFGGGGGGGGGNIILQYEIVGSDSLSVRADFDVQSTYVIRDNIGGGVPLGWTVEWLPPSGSADSSWLSVVDGVLTVSPRFTLSYPSSDVTYSVILRANLQAPSGLQTIYLEKEITVVVKPPFVLRFDLTPIRDYYQYVPGSTYVLSLPIAFFQNGSSIKATQVVWTSIVFPDGWPSSMEFDSASGRFLGNFTSGDIDTYPDTYEVVVTGQITEGGQTKSFSSSLFFNKATAAHACWYIGFVDFVSIKPSMYGPEWTQVTFKCTDKLQSAVLHYLSPENTSFPTNWSVEGLFESIESPDGPASACQEPIPIFSNSTQCAMRLAPGASAKFEFRVYVHRSELNRLQQSVLYFYYRAPSSGSKVITVNNVAW